jgi:hypothetical protein
MINSTSYLFLGTDVQFFFLDNPINKSFIFRDGHQICVNGQINEYPNFRGGHQIFHECLIKESTIFRDRE